MNKKLLFSIIAVVFVGGMFTVAYAGPIINTITFTGLAIFKENVQMDKDLNVDGPISGQTIDAINDKFTNLQFLLSKDIVVVNQFDNDISVLLGNGDGTFVRTDVAVGDQPVSVAIGNLNLPT